MFEIILTQAICKNYRHGSRQRGSAPSSTGFRITKWTNQPPATSSTVKHSTVEADGPPGPPDRPVPSGAAGKSPVRRPLAGSGGIRRHCRGRRAGRIVQARRLAGESRGPPAPPGQRPLALITLLSPRQRPLPGIRGQPYART